jgi:hypothetical protein
MLQLPATIHKHGKITPKIYLSKLHLISITHHYAPKIKKQVN